MNEPARTAAIAEEDALRADLYDYLSALLARPPERELIERTRALEGDITELGQAVSSLATIAGRSAEPGLEREFARLFIGLGRGELLPYASYYMTGFLNERPLAALRAELRRLGVRRADNVFEPEDNIATLCEVMGGLIRGRFGAPAPLDAQREFFARHMAPWAEHFFTDLERAKGSLFYAPVGSMGRVFMTIEKEAFRLAA